MTQRFCKCGKALTADPGHSGPWGTFYLCEDHGIISAIHIIYQEVN